MSGQGYLLARFTDKVLQLDLEKIKQLHVQYIRQLEPKVFENDPSSIQETEEELTDFFFRDPMYIIEWIEKNVDWHILMDFFHIDNMHFEEWKQSIKIIVFDQKEQ